MRVALVRSTGSSAWRSCVSITYNLARSYESIEGIETREFALDRAGMSSGILEILEYAPDLLAIIDYGAFQPEFLKAWFETDEDAPLPPTHLHCFGDFPLAAAQWAALAPRLLGLPIRFIAASDASAGLVRGLLSAAGTAPPSICPFPIDCENFRPSQAEGDKFRQALGVRPDELLLLYTGRLSLQKNTALLARLASRYAVSRGVKLTLAFAGEADDIGADFLGIDLGTGHYLHHFHEEILASLEASPIRIAMLGNLDPDDLRRAYNAADAFVSLSMHHDEDYGMSPGEALCCGTPVILSGWGGFHSFPLHVPSELRSQTAFLVGLENDGKNVSIVSKDFFEALDRRRSSASTRSIRSRLARGAEQSLSIAATSRMLHGFLAEKSPPFTGFSHLLERLAQFTHVPGRYRSRRFDDPSYRKLYAPYFRPIMC